MGPKSVDMSANSSTTNFSICISNNDSVLVDDSARITELILLDDYFIRMIS